MKKIYVQIAAFRDPELVNTLDDLFNTAEHPERITVCIIWQYDEEDEFDQRFKERYLDHDQVTVVPVEAHESRGACWARHHSQRYMKDEDYVLQLDSHVRMIEHWDTLLIDKLESLKTLGYEKPIISTYLANMNPVAYPRERSKRANRLILSFYTIAGVPILSSVPTGNSPKEKEQSRELNGHTHSLGIAGGLIFADSHWNKTVKYDPQLYFMGEEITLAARSYTHGYDIFCPTYQVGWHEYGRKNKPKKPRKKSRHDRDMLENISIQRVKCLLNIDNHRELSTQKMIESVDKFGLGNIRTLEEYEIFAGVEFKNRKHLLTSQKLMCPPFNEFSEKLHRFTMDLLLNEKHLQIREDEGKKFDGIVILVKTEEGEQIFRKDIIKSAVKNLAAQLDEMTDQLGAKKNSHARININFWKKDDDIKFPAECIYWPYNSATEKWGTKIIFKIKNAPPITEMNYLTYNALKVQMSMMDTEQVKNYMMSIDDPVDYLDGLEIEQLNGDNRCRM